MLATLRCSNTIEGVEVLFKFVLVVWWKGFETGINHRVSGDAAFRITVDLGNNACGVQINDKEIRIA